MAESSWPTVAGSRAVTDDQFELMAAAWSADGVVGQWTQSSPVFADSTGRQVKVRANFLALVGGHGYSSGTSDTIKSVTANASGSTRIDLVVLGLDRTTLAVTSYVKAGTPGSGSPPALQQDARGLTTGKWEIPIGQVTVVNGASNLSPSDAVNYAWFSRGDAVAVAAAAPIQPSASLYPYLIHTDTGHRFESVSNAWRRHPWQSAGGVVGGQRYTAGIGAALVNGGGTSEVNGNIATGSITLRANRRFRIRAFVRASLTATTSVLSVRVRETNTSGAIRAEWHGSNANTGYFYPYEAVGEYSTGSSDETKSYIVTGQVSSGLFNFNAGDSGGNLVGIWVEDIGPASPNVVTVIP